MQHLEPLREDEQAELNDPTLPPAHCVAKLAALILKRAGATRDDIPLYSPQIRQAAKELYPAIFERIKETTFGSYLQSAPTRDQRIVSLGTARGYYLDESAIAFGEGGAEQLEALPSEEGVVRGPRENILYEPVKNWLLARGYQSKIVSDGKALGPWGNPDVVGIQSTEILGALHPQTVSVEVKRNNANWKREIFESISHKRYFDRSYFCYPVRADNRTISEEMKDYAELYGVGVLLIEIETAQYDGFVGGGSLDLDKVAVTEVCPAPYTEVMPRYRREALRAIGITDLSSLYTWGDKPAS